MIYFVVPREQDFGIRDYTETWGRNLEGILSVMHYEELPRRESLPMGTYVFSALDQLTPEGIDLVREIQRKLRAAPAPCRVLNDPARALNRLELLEELYRKGLNRHRAFRAAEVPSDLRFPVFIREEARHTGPLSTLLFHRSELERALGRAVLQGHRLRDLLIMEFYDTADSRGLYRKYSAYVVGSQVIARTMGRAHGWMLKADGVEFDDEMFREERAFVESNPYADQLGRIFDVAGIEYGRIDFSVKDDIVETWEINTNPSVGPSRHKVIPKELASARQPIRDLFSERFRAALSAVDCPASSQVVPLDLDGSSSRRPPRVVRPPAKGGMLVRVVAALRPLRPLLDAAEPLVSRALARIVKGMPR